MNTMLEAVRQTLLLEKGADPDDIYMQTIKAAQLSEDDFFGNAISKDLMEILSTIRENHGSDPTTADATGTDMVKNALYTATAFEGSAEEAKLVLFLSTIGIKYNKLTKDELVTLIRILRKSDLLKSPSSKRVRGKKEIKKTGPDARVYRVSEPVFSF